MLILLNKLLLIYKHTDIARKSWKINYGNLDNNLVLITVILRVAFTIITV